MSIMDSNQSSWRSLPEGIVALFCIQVFSTLSYSVLYSTLVLYITSQLGLTMKSANSITGVFVAFNFALHLLGGYWGGRFFSYRSLFSIGMIAQIVGCVLLATGLQAYLYPGLAAFLTGCGLNVTCINCMLTQRFKPHDTRRESAFLFNYAGMNIGFFVGFTLSGYFQLSHNYQQLFLLSSLGNLAALLLCLYFWHSLADKSTFYASLDKQNKRQKFIRGLFMILGLPFILSQLLHFADLANSMVLLTGAIMLIASFASAFREKTRQAREKIHAFGLLMLIGTIFWMLYQIGPMGLTHFIEHNVQRHWLLVTIPPQWFQNINTLCIVIGGPLLSLALNALRVRGFNINIPSQFALSLLLIGLAFVLLPIGIAQANAKGLVSPGWVVASFILQSLGELLISPIGYAMIGALAPPSMLGIMMGMWMLTSGVGATLASYCSNLMTDGLNSVNPLVTNAGYSWVFLCLGLFAMLAGLLLSFLTPTLKRWMNQEQSETIKKAQVVPI